LTHQNKNQPKKRSKKCLKEILTRNIGSMFQDSKIILMIFEIMQCLSLFTGCVMQIDLKFGELRSKGKKETEEHGKI